MSADQITINLTAGVAATSTAPGTPDALSQVLITEAAATSGTLLPAAVPPFVNTTTLSFGLTQEPDAVTQMIAEPI